MSAQKAIPSIFNDVIGPVMVGASSSHTAGPVRIGRLVRQIAKGKITKANIIFDANGSFAQTYQGQKTDKGLIAGLLGWDTDDLRMAQSAEVAEASGLLIRFGIEDLAATHPNTVKIMIEDETGSCNAITALSLGGGRVELTNINGVEVSISGEYFDTIIILHDTSRSELNEIAQEIKLNIDVKQIDLQIEADKSLIDVKSTEMLTPRIARITNHPKVQSVTTIRPIMPIIPVKPHDLLFTTAKEMLQIATEQKLKLWQISASYEADLGQKKPEEIYQQMIKIVNVIQRSLDQGLHGKLHLTDILRPQARYLLKAEEEGKLIPAHTLNTVIALSMAMMEVKSSLGVIVAAPTAGACGVLPGAIFGTARILGAGNEEIAKAMLAAGGIGLLIAHHATFAAELCGCQVECGAGSAMAAAGIVQLVEGTAEQGIAAASIALQNVFGLTCDPVANLVEVPCLGKNVLCAVNAVASANMALAGVDPVIPLDEVITSMYEVGLMLPRELRCTGLGGLATTKTSREIRTRLNQDLRERVNPKSTQS
jgi:L-serine dehydratase